MYTSWGLYKPIAYSDSSASVRKQFPLFPMTNVTLEINTYNHIVEFMKYETFMVCSFSKLNVNTSINSFIANAIPRTI